MSIEKVGPPSSGTLPSPPVLGLVGGVGSGKSTVAKILARHGAAVLDADRAAHEVLREPEVVQALVGHFGPGVLGPDQTIDRKRLGQLVFGADQAESRRFLEQLVHPKTRERLRATRSELQARRPPPLCLVLDVPLLLEGPLSEWCDVVIFIDTPLEVRRARCVRDRQWSEEELSKREAAQLGIDTKRSRSREVISNRGSHAELEVEVLRLLERLSLVSGPTGARPTSD